MDNNGLTSESSFQQLGMANLRLEEATSLIVAKAKQLVNRLVDYRGHDKPPFLPEQYSRLVNVKEIQKTSLGETSGILLKFHDGYVIKVNQDHYKVRQNFSCAHEIGHILFNELQLNNYIRNIEYRTFNPSKTREMQARARERLCDSAAAELLMPELVFKKYISNWGLSISLVEHLANIFEVSILSAARRIAEVSIEPCIAILWQPWPKVKPKGLRPVGGQAGGKANHVLVNKFANVSSTLYKAYKNDHPVKSWKDFRSGNTVNRLPLEAKGFGSAKTRFVISLAFPGR